ncbi:hypothetical protein PFISCL1PPCAC_24895, partial [Pristionchus fissidentatus]
MEREGEEEKNGFHLVSPLGSLSRPSLQLSHVSPAILVLLATSPHHPHFRRFVDSRSIPNKSTRRQIEKGRLRVTEDSRLGRIGTASRTNDRTTTKRRFLLGHNM